MKLKNEILKRLDEWSGLHPGDFIHGNLIR